MTTTAYDVSGMTCEHCVRAVTTEVLQVDGVQDVEVDLTEGRVVVRSEQAVDDSAVREAVDEAGYTVTGGPREVPDPA